MKARLNILFLAIATLLMIGCGGVEQPGAAEVLRPDDQTLTGPVDVELLQRVPPLPAIVRESSDDSPTAPGESAAEDTPAEETAGTPESEPELAVDPEPVSSEFARFTGRITVEGDFSTLAPLVRAGDSTARDSAICAESAIPNESVLVTDGGLADVFVYARTPDGIEVPAPPEEPAVIDQKGCRFVPQAQVFRVEQTLQMINSDPVPHNVRISGFRKSLNQTIGPNDPVGITTDFQSAEPVPFQTKCDFHTWMISWHLPAENPWATVSGEDGRFVIDNLPPADEWEFVIWHNKTGYIDRVRFGTTAGELIEMPFTVPAAELQ